MALLPLEQAIARFKENDERLDVFANGDDTDSYLASDGLTSVPSIQKFLKDKDAEINVGAASLLSQTTEQVALAQDAAGEASDSAAVAVAAASSTALPASPAAGTFLRRNAGNTAYESRTPPQVIGDLGITATATELNQLDGVTLGSAAVLGVATQTEAEDGTNSDVAMTPLRVKQFAVLGFSASFATNGYIKLPSWLGGLIIQWGFDAGNMGDHNVTLPIAFPTAKYGVFVQPTPTTALSTGESLSFAVGNPSEVTFFSLHPRYVNNGGGVGVAVQASYWLAIGK